VFLCPRWRLLSPSSYSRGRDAATLFEGKYPDAVTLCGGWGWGHDNFIPLSPFDYFWRQRGYSTRALHGLTRNCKGFVELLGCGERHTELRTSDSDLLPRLLFNRFSGVVFAAEECVKAETSPLLMQYPGCPRSDGRHPDNASTHSCPDCHWIFVIVAEHVGAHDWIFVMKTERADFCDWIFVWKLNVPACLTEFPLWNWTYRHAWLNFHYETERIGMLGRIFFMKLNVSACVTEFSLWNWTYRYVRLNFHYETERIGMHD
jgi:hypothetical protein